MVFVMRKYDITVFGATGHCGKLAIEYLARFYGKEYKFAIAGRNRSKLEAVREEFAQGILWTY